MKTVLFLVRRDKISARRFLSVAGLLEKEGIRPCFLNLSQDPDILTEAASEIGETGLNNHKVYDYLKSVIDYAEYLINAKIKRQLFKISNKRLRISGLKPQLGEGGEFAWLLAKLGFDTQAIVDEYYSANIDRWIFHCKTAKNLISKIKPDIVVFDLEMQSEIRSFLFTAKEENIFLFSMQHGEGFCEPYCNFPRLADFYIAYSRHNAEIIKSMGVPDENIFLTGLPDTDIISNFDAEKIKKELSISHKIDFSRKIILLALRPANTVSLKEANHDLIKAVGDTLGNDKKFCILVKRHNADYILGLPAIDYNLKYNNFVYIDSDYHFSKVLKVSRLLITHLSSCIVQAAVLTVPSIVIEFNSTGQWPAWNMHGIFHYIHRFELEKILKDIKNGDYSFRPAEEARQKFIERFSFKSDNKSAQRIVCAFKGVLAGI